MRFMPHTDGDVAAMLETIGAKHLDDLIAHVPANLRAAAAINLEHGRSEEDVVREISMLAARNAGASDFVSFLGAGYYRHYVPAAVRSIIARAEFATSYTPYQAEASQGTTQAIFEFQTLITQLTALEVANASMYDGASAAAEAVLMARRLMPERPVVALARRFAGTCAIRSSRCFAPIVSSIDATSRSVCGMNLIESACPHSITRSQLMPHGSHRGDRRAAARLLPEFCDCEFQLPESRRRQPQ